MRIIYEGVVGASRQPKAGQVTHGLGIDWLVGGFISLVPPASPQQFILLLDLFQLSIPKQTYCKPLRVLQYSLELIYSFPPWQIKLRPFHFFFCPQKFMLALLTIPLILFAGLLLRAWKHSIGLPAEGSVQVASFPLSSWIKWGRLLLSVKHWSRAWILCSFFYHLHLPCSKEEIVKESK